MFAGKYSESAKQVLQVMPCKNISVKHAVISRMHAKLCISNFNVILKIFKESSGRASLNIT